MKPHLPLHGIRRVETRFSADKLANDYERIADSDDFFYTDAAFPALPECVCLPETQRG